MPKPNDRFSIDPSVGDHFHNISGGIAFLKKYQIGFFCVAIELAIIFLITCANWTNQSLLYALFYNLGYGLLLSVALPLAYARHYKEPLSDFGIKKVGIRQLIVLLSFVAFSIGGQVIPRLLAHEELRFYLLPISIAPILMTTFFEEFLFRGFMQTRLEKQVGAMPAILLSGLFFSLYHLGYPGFRNLQDLGVLFAVGIGFALAFKLSGNNLFVSFFVNLPNAYLTYLLKAEQFPRFQPVTTVYACLTILLIPLLFYVCKKRNAN